MKKLIAGVAVAFLMMAGLVAGTSTTASAGPYSGSVSTIANARATPSTIRPGQRPKVRINIRGARGNGVPRGPVQITISSRDGSFVRVFKRYYNGSPRNYTFPRINRPGNYSVIVTYIGFSQSVYRPSATASNLRIRR